MPFQKATKQQSKLRMALIGPSGSGKTYTALKIASAMVKRIALIDTERGSASKYADKWDFDVLELAAFSPERYMQAIREAEQAGYELLIIDSLTHAWSGREGALEMVDRAAKRSQSGNSYIAWREVTPVHNQLVDTILQANMHIIATMRTKTEYIQEKDERSGKMVPKKIGLAPVQRDGLEYEFDVIGDMTPDNELIISKTRCEALNGQSYKRPGTDVAAVLKAWVSEGIAPRPKPTPTPAPEPAPTDKVHTDLEKLSRELHAAGASQTREPEAAGGVPPIAASSIADPPLTLVAGWKALKDLVGEGKANVAYQQYLSQHPDLAQQPPDDAQQLEITLILLKAAQAAASRKARLDAAEKPVAAP